VPPFGVVTLILPVTAVRGTTSQKLDEPACPKAASPALAHLRFLLQHRKVIYTTNLLERLSFEERRRTKIIPHAFGERPESAPRRACYTSDDENLFGVVHLMQSCSLPSAFEDRW
jgi:hypothetical protein